MIFDLSIFVQQYAVYLLAMVLVQVGLGTVAHLATRERGLDDTCVGALGLAILLGGPSVVLGLAGLDARLPSMILLWAAVLVGVVKFIEWAKRKPVVDIALFVLLTLGCLLPPGLLAVWLVVSPMSVADLLSSLTFVLVSVGAVGFTAMGWDWHHHTICGYPYRKADPLQLPNHQQDMLDDVLYTLNKQAHLIQDLLDGNMALEQLGDDLRERQKNLGQGIDLIDKYRRLSTQTLEDLQKGVTSCYIAREKVVEQQMQEESDRGNTNASRSMRIVER